MSPRLVSIHEYRFVRPEDVLPSDEVVEDDAVLDSPWSEYAQAARDCTPEKLGLYRAEAERRRAAGDTEGAAFLDRYANGMEGALRTEERTVLVRRSVPLDRAMGA